MSNLKFQNALQRIPQDTPPIWFMRQAGRYHRHYQDLKKSHSFMELCKNPALAAEVAMGPIEDFDFDVAILFSDLLFPLEALGMGLDYPDGAGPQLGWQLTGGTLSKLKSPDSAISDLLFQGEAVRLTRQRLPSDKSLIGFVGGPWTLFGYAVEGRHLGGLPEARRQIEIFKPFCNILVPLLEMNIKNQLDNGAEIVMLFDTAAGDLNAPLFLNYVREILSPLSQKFPKRLGYYSKKTNSSHLNNEFYDSMKLFAGFGYDAEWSITERLETQDYGFVQGNFNQEYLLLDTESFQKKLNEYLEAIKKLSPEKRCGWVCGLGHGVLPKTPEGHVRYFVKTVRERFANSQ